MKIKLNEDAMRRHFNNKFPLDTVFEAKEEDRPVGGGKTATFAVNLTFEGNTYGNQVVKIQEDGSPSYEVITEDKVNLEQERKSLLSKHVAELYEKVIGKVITNVFMGGGNLFIVAYSPVTETSLITFKGEFEVE